MPKVRVLTLMLIVLLVPVISAQGHPTSTPHPHDDNNVKWEKDGTKDGSSAHNHVINNDFGGKDEQLRIYNAVSCWDDNTYRFDDDGKFDKGHCYINEYGIPTRTVKYQFTESAGPTWNAEGKNRVRDAFDEWSAAFAVLSLGNATGIRFVEGTPADFQVRMNNIGYIGQWLPDSKIMEFDSSGRNWSYEKNNSGISEFKDHFYSVALHEAGHVVGLHHRMPGDLMDPGVGNAVIGAAEIYNGLQWNSISPGALSGAWELYSKPAVAPSASTIVASVEFVYCSNDINTYTVTFGGETIYPDDFFEVERKIGSSWYPWYTGGESCAPVSTGADSATFQVRIGSIGGNSVWVGFEGYADCDTGEDPE